MNREDVKELIGFIIFWCIITAVSYFLLAM